MVYPQGHLDDQAMMGLCVLRHPEWVRIDVNADLFLSHYAYVASWFSTPACSPGYIDARGNPPYQIKTGRRPFVLHFNGPSGRYRMAQCMNYIERTCDPKAGTSSASHSTLADMRNAKTTTRKNS